MKMIGKSGVLMHAFMAVTAAVLTVCADYRVKAAQLPAGCQGNNFSVNVINLNGQVDITNGAVVTFVTTVSQVSDPSSCNVVLSSNGLAFKCPDANGNPNGGTTILIPPFTVIPGGAQSPPFQLKFTNQCTVVLNPGVRTAQVEVTDGGAVLQDNPLQDDPAAIIKTLSFNVYTPCIQVTKQCNGGPFLYGQPISFVGTVTNCGDRELDGVQVVDDHAGVLISGLTLQPDQGTNFSATYIPGGNPCGPFTNTVTATGIAPLTTPVTAVGTASAICTIITAPCIKVTKNCPASISYGTTNYVVGGVVTNCGNVPLVGVTVVDDNGTPGNPADDIPIVIGSLPIGGSAAYSATNNVPAACGPFTDTVIATGAGLCGGAVSATNSCTTMVTTAPAIAVVKACPPNPVQPGGLMAVTGTVTNTGNVPLVNVVVTNSISALGISRQVLGPISLAPGTGTNFSDSYILPLDSCGPYVDTFTASGADTCSGVIVTAFDTKACAGTNSPSIAVTKTCPPNPVQPGSLMVVTGTVTNTGNITLNNVLVTNSIGALGVSRRVLGPISLAPGAGTNFTDSYILPLDSCGPYVDTFAASGADKCFGRVVTNSATAACPGTNSPSIAVTKTCPPNPVQPGSLMVVTGTVTNTGNITLNNVLVTNSIGALGVSRRVLGPISLAPGAGTNFSDSYILPLDSCGPYVDTFAASGADKCFGRVVTNSATAACPGTNSPSIAVTKTCPPNPVQPGSLMVVTGTVTNTGNITLNNVLVTNTIAALGNLSRRVYGPVTLAPGAGAVFTDSYLIPPDSCGPYVDTFAASGADKCFGRVVTSSATTACAGTNSPRIEVTKNCPVVPTAPGQITTIFGVVSNAGNVTLTNVIVVDDQPSNNTVVLGPITLIPGQMATFTNSYRLPQNSCLCIDTVIASGNDKCFGKTVTDSATAACPTATDARITVTKTCPPLPVPLGQPLVFSGTVSNAGNITLTNVVVVDNQPSNNTPVFGPVTLAPGATASFIGGYIVPINICDTTIADTVTARGNNLCNGATVSASQSALCPIQPTPQLVVTKNCPAAPVPPGGLLVFSGSVSNAGTITLTNVLVFNDHPTNNTPVLGPITLAPNQSTNFVGSYQVCPLCCPPYVDTLTASGAQICNGSNVTATATAYCPGITTPKLNLTVNCPPVPVSQGQLLIYSGTVSNAGDVALGYILVSDDKVGLVTEISALAPGETEDFLGFFTPTNCGPELLTSVSATALDICTGGSVSNQVSASCLVICPTNVPPILVSPAVNGKAFVFSFGTVPGTSITVQFTPSLSPVNWQTLTNFTGDGSVVTITDASATNQQRFYRVLSQ